MKNTAFKNTACTFACIILISLLISGCFVSNRIYKSDDLVNQTKRFELKYDFNDRDRRSPLLFFTQTIVKEIHSENDISFTAYDVLSLSGNSFKLDEKVFIVIGKEVFPMTIDKIEYEHVKSLSENTESIATSDSTSVSVITGYSENNRKITKFSYRIPVEVMVKIKESGQFFLQYYSGPSILTVKPKKKSIKKLQQLIDLK